jgi:hypothetical protein
MRRFSEAGRDAFTPDAAPEGTKEPEDTEDERAGEESLRSLMSHFVTPNVTLRQADIRLYTSHLRLNSPSIHSLKPAQRQPIPPRKADFPSADAGTRTRKPFTEQRILSPLAGQV